MVYMESFKDQNYLFPPNIRDLFSKNHVCYLIEQLAEDLDYSKFDEMYAGAGHPAYHPRILVKLLLMAHADGMRSSRRIAKNVQENVVYIYLAEKTQPDFRTISDFRKDNEGLMKSVTKRVTQFAWERGLIDLSHLMVDGTTIKANANGIRIMEKEALEKLDKFIDKALKEGIQIDEEEDKEYGDRGMHELPKDLHDPKRRRPVIQKIVKEINESLQNGDEPGLKKTQKQLKHLKSKMQEKNLKKYSFTDPEARFMLNKKGRIELSYNAQLVTDKNGLIIGENVVQECDDRNQLLPNINNVEKDFGPLAEGTIVGADAGCENAKALEELDQRGYDVHVPLKGMKPESKQKTFSKTNFEYDEKQDAYICPENKLLKNVGSYFNKNRNERLTRYDARKEDCLTCPHKNLCAKKSDRRAIHALPQDKLLNRIRTKLQTDKGKAIMKIRQQTVECGFGDIKHNKGFRGFLTRGINQVRTEWTLVCAAANLIKINNLLHPPPKKTQKTYQIKKKNRNILDLILFQTQKGLKLT